jgi:hypothetical protein
VSPVGGKMTEAELQTSLRRAAREFGWMEHCAWLSIRSPKGWPDLTLAKGMRLIVAELKAEKGKTTPEQDAWLAWWREFADAVAIAAQGTSDLVHVYTGERPDAKLAPRIEVYVWRPTDLEDAYRVLMS